MTDVEIGAGDTAFRTRSSFGNVKVVADLEIATVDLGALQREVRSAT